MPFVTYEETKEWAVPIREAVRTKKMPPWFADPSFEHFADDPSLTPQQIATFTAWADAGAPAGDPHDAAPPRHWTTGWNIDPPDRIVQMPSAVAISANGDVEYTYEIVSTQFT